MRDDGPKPGERRLPELRRLWAELRATPFPAGSDDDPRVQEIALYASWLGPIAEAAIARGGRVAPVHARMLEQRRSEAGGELWAAAGELGEAARTFVGRLMAIEELLSRLPIEP
jgi:hypothetical protein